MTPLRQTRFYDPTLPADQQRGNCLQAVLASLLDSPLDAVPHFVQDHVDHDGDNNPEWDWWHRMVAWLAERGWGMHHALPLSDYPGEHLAVSGPSPRGNGIHHITIYRDGDMVHDPHPDDTGILAETHAWGLHRIDAPEVRV